MRASGRSRTWSSTCWSASATRSAAPGILVPPAGGADRPGIARGSPSRTSPRWSSGCARVPPRWSPMALPPLDRAVNTLEYFVHHEDIRRARRTGSRASSPIASRRPSGRSIDGGRQGPGAPRRGARRDPLAGDERERSAVLAQGRRPGGGERAPRPSWRCSSSAATSTRRLRVPGPATGDVEGAAHRETREPLTSPRSVDRDVHVVVVVRRGRAAVRHRAEALAGTLDRPDALATR